MSGRNLDPHHIREATQTASDGQINQTVRAFEAVARGEYKGARSRHSESDQVAHKRPEGEVWIENTPAAVATALERSRIVPLALTRPCPTCGAPAGTSCVASLLAACGSRVSVAQHARAAEAEHIGGTSSSAVPMSARHSGARRR